MRMRDDEAPSPGPISPINDIVWIDINWSFTEPPPVGLATGFEVIAYTGSNPNDTTTYLRPPAEVPAADRRLVFSYGLSRGTTLPTVNAAVRTIYPWGRSDWASSGASVSSATTNTQNIGADNLIPNPTGELGALATGYAQAGLVNDAGNAYAGSWVRRNLATTAGTYTALTPLISCIYGDQFSFHAYLKNSAAGADQVMILNFYDAAGTYVGNKVGTWANSTTYAERFIQGAVPAGALYVQAFYGNSVASSGQYVYADNLSLRRSVSPAMMDSDSGFRVINAIKNSGATASDRVWYAGNNDQSVSGGGPKIADDDANPAANPRVLINTVYSGVLVTNAFTQNDIVVQIQPRAASDNLDGLRCIFVTTYYKNGTAGVKLRETMAYPIGDRRYRVPGTDTDSGNIAYCSFTINGNQVTVGNYVEAKSTVTYPLYMLIQIVNASGESTSHWFSPPSANGQGSSSATGRWTDIGTANPFTSGGSSGGGGGGGGGGGPCPAPWTMIDLPGGEQKRAAELEVGDRVMAIHSSGTVGPWPVSAVSLEENERWDLFVVGRDEPYTFSRSHLLRTDRGWSQIQDLVEGDEIIGTTRTIVEYVAYRDVGAVVKISVDKAGSYLTDGMLSSNAKPTD